MNVINDSAKHSAVLTIAESKATDVLNYSLSKSLNYVGGLGVQKVPVNATNFAGGMLAGSPFQINLPQYGLLRRAFLRFTVSNATAFNTVTCKYPGINAFSKICLQTTSGNVISTLFPDVITHKMLQRPDASKLVYGCGSAGLTLNSTFVVLYTPLLFGLFDCASTWPDLMSMEELCIMFYPRVQTEWCTVGAGSLLSTPAVDLLCYFALPQPERYQALLQEKHSGGSNWNTIIPSCFKESQLVTGNSAAADFMLYVGAPVVRSIIVVRLGVTGSTSADLVQPTALSSLTVSDSGNSIAISNGSEVYLENGVADVLNTTNYIIVDWCLTGQYGTDNPRACSGVSLYSMSNPKLSFVFSTAAVRYIDVYHEILQAASVTASPNMKNRQISILSDK
jgi:hypothetical protein